VLRCGVTCCAAARRAALRHGVLRCGKDLDLDLDLDLDFEDAEEEELG
jgi:hypothetical protein